MLIRVELLKQQVKFLLYNMLDILNFQKILKYSYIITAGAGFADGFHWACR